MSQKVWFIFLSETSLESCLLISVFRHRGIQGGGPVTSALSTSAHFQITPVFLAATTKKKRKSHKAIFTLNSYFVLQGGYVFSPKLQLFHLFLLLFFFFGGHLQIDFVGKFVCRSRDKEVFFFLFVFRCCRCRLRLPGSPQDIEPSHKHKCIYLFESFYMTD